MIKEKTQFDIRINTEIYTTPKLKLLNLKSNLLSLYILGLKTNNMF